MALRLTRLCSPPLLTSSWKDLTVPLLRRVRRGPSDKKSKRGDGERLSPVRGANRGSLLDSGIMDAMKRMILWLSVLLAMAGTAPASAAFLSANPRLGESLLNTGIEQVAGDVSREGLPGFGGIWLRGASEFFVAPANALTHGHHPLPKFLGGDTAQTLSRLDPKIHREFHSLLRSNLKEAGIPLNVGGRGGSAADWAQYMNTHPGAQRDAFDAVLGVSRSIDAKYGTSITQDVWHSVMGGNFTPHP